MNTLISHEVPNSILKASQSFNDYDYMLDYCYNDPVYKQYYVDAIRDGRRVMYDNSVYEYRDKIPPMEVFQQHVCEIKPYWYLITDHFDDGLKTIETAKRWEKEFLDITPGIAIGVCQGKSLEELVACYKYFSNSRIPKIAFNFSSIVYEQLAPEYENRFEKWCIGRQRFIQYLVDNGLWDYHKPHHLLGCSLVREFTYPLYAHLNIETMDTSNPVVAALEGLEYDECGVVGDKKPSILLCDLLKREISDDEMRNILSNVNIFKNIIMNNKIERI